MQPEQGRFFTNYSPRPFQYDLHLALKRYNVIVSHRRFGKSIFAVNHMIDHLLMNNYPLPRYAFIAPTYQMAKRIIWDNLKRYADKIPGVTFNEADMRADFEGNKGRIMLLSAENYESLKGIYLDGVVLDEHAQMSPSVWTEAIRPTLIDRKGWAIFTSTPKGQNQFYELYQYAKNSGDPDWYQDVFPVSRTRLIDQGELDSLKRTMSEEEYAQEFECDFTAGLAHAYFSKELKKADVEGRIKDIPYDPMIPVDTYWDLGMSDATAVTFVQSTRFEHRIIDYYETHGEGLDKIIPHIKNKYPYNYDEWVLPHDVQVRDLSTGKARLQMFHNMGVRKTRVVPRVGEKLDSINAARVIFQKCYFDKKKTELLIKSLTNYQKKFDDKNQVYLKTPLHNWASNAADSFQCFAMGVRENMGVFGENNARFMGEHEQLVAETEYDVYSYGGAHG